ncbi:MAG: PAS domain S-box protein [Chitinophagaceae bacterium]|nr:MAG: PAS domain S-box protein [Chitinophagaceae bacterium]
MNSNFKLDFEQARAKHLAFKSKLRSYLFGLPVDEAPIRDPAICSVGKWIYSHALNSYGHFPEMQELEQVHARLHQIAGGLVDLYDEGKVNAAKAGLSEVEEIAARLMNLLSVIEEKVSGSAADESSLTSDFGLNEFVELRNANEELEKVIRVQAQASMKEQETLYDVFLQLPAHVSLVMGPEFVFELVNPPALAAIGNRDIIGKRVADAFPELAEQGFLALLENVFRTGEVYKAKELHAWLKNEDGTQQEYYADVTYLPFRNNDGIIVGVLSFSYDVTETVKARRDLQESEERFRFMSDALPNQSWTAKADGALDYVNERTTEYFGKSADEIIGAGWKDLLHPEDLESVAIAWSKSLETLDPYRVEFRLLAEDGNYRWHLAQANAFKSGNGEVKWFGSNTDIHEIKSLQERLQQSYDDLEVKVRFRNIELEREIMELKKQLNPQQ